MELENTFGRKILSSRDCLQLVEDIRIKTGFSVNANTLRRFFGLVKSPYKPSPSTLTILLKYCGYNSLEELSDLNNRTLDGAAPTEESILHFLTSLYKSLPLVEGHNNTAELVVMQTIPFLDRHPGLVDAFQREVARTTSGRYYYYEMSVNMDRLDDYYGDGLFHYLRANPTPEGKIFAHSLLVLRYWLTHDKTQLDRHMQELMGIQVPSACPSHILGRLMAARILYADIHHQSVDGILADATKYLVSLLAGSQGIAIPTYPDFELAVCEALVLTGHEVEGAEFIRRGNQLLSFSRKPVAVSPFRLWEFIIFSKKNPSRRTLPGTKPEKDLPSGNVLNRRYQNLVRIALTKSNAKERKQLADLVAETGFLVFKTTKSRFKKPSGQL